MSVTSETAGIVAPLPGTVAYAEPSMAGAGDYLALLKPRVMSLVVFTALAGLLLAPVHMHPVLALFALVCIAVGAGSAGALNMWYDADIDALMTRTAERPVPSGRVTDRQLEKILAGAGRLGSAAKPILEINPTHALVTALAAQSKGENAFREDAVQLLLDEARILDGEKPADPKAFSERLARVLERALR